MSKELQSYLSSNYSRTNFKSILVSTFDENVQFFSSPTILTEIDSKISKEIVHLGSIQFTEGYVDRNIGLFEVQLQDSIQIDRNRVGVRNLLKKYYKNLDGVLVSYYSIDKKEWRLSFISEINTIVDGKYVPSVTQSKRFTYILGEGEKTKTPTQRFIQLKDVEKLSLDEIKKAFSVEALTEEFFLEFKNTFHKLDTVLFKQSKDKIFSHDYSLQFMNRILFLYFLQKLELVQFGKNKDFLYNLYEVYKTSKSKDGFVQDWLLVLFLDAFNNQYTPNKKLPKEVQQSFENAPFLNGGLYRENDLDRRFSSEKLSIKDKDFEEILDLLERYNFTVIEDNPMDQDVAVDPEMIGKVYESLVNVSIESDEQGDAGMFYTERTEIDLMCRLSLVNFLTNHFGQQYKKLFYQFVFCQEEELSQEVLDYFSKNDGWKKLHDTLLSLTVLDPSCGSGSFLVGMLDILYTLHSHIDKQIPTQMSKFRRKKQIIANSLYGVDVMEWAIHIAELRLWLQLILDVHTEPERIKEKKVPLLPHFSFNLRCGDSIVQSIGKEQFSHVSIGQKTKGKITDTIRELQMEKLYYFHNDEKAKYKDKKDLEDLEITVFKDSMEHQKEEILSQLQLLLDKNSQQKSQDLFVGGKDSQKEKKFKEETDRQKNQLKEELDILEHSLNTINSAKELPFIYDIAFVEIFESSKNGFDIVIGNPPYIRQEKIADPRILDKKLKEQTKK